MSRKKPSPAASLEPPPALIHGRVLAAWPAADVDASCLGHLEWTETHGDSEYVRGTVRVVQVDVYTCQSCGGRVAMTGRVVRNAYAVPERDEMLKALAENWRVPGPSGAAHPRD